MKSKDFFSKIRSGIKKNRYTDRFLQELKDHLEDATEEQIFMGETKANAKKKALKKLGDPGDIARNYNVMTHQGSLLAMYLEGFLFGILSVPLYLNSQNLNFVFPMEPFEILEKVIATIIFFVVIGSLGFILYSFAFSRFMVAGKNRPWIHWYAYLAALFSPPLAVYVLTLTLNWGRSTAVLTAGHIFTYFIPPLAVAALTFYRNHQGIVSLSERSILKKPQNKKWLLIIPLYCLAAHLVNFSLTPENSIHPLLSLTLIPFYTFKFFLQIMAGIIFLTAPRQLSMIGSSWVLAFFLAGLGILSAAVIGEALKKKKTIPTIYIFLLGMIIPLLFFAPLNFPEITWHAPSSHISGVIEQKQTWPFYRFIRYTSSDFGFNFSYGIFSTGYKTLEDVSGFQVTQYPGERFALTNIQSVDAFELKNEGKNLVDLYSMPIDEQAFLALPQGFSCEADFPPPEASQNLAIPCQKLLYNQKVLYETKEQLFLYDLKRSPDQKFALINLGESWFNPKEVYLLEL